MRSPPGGRLAVGRLPPGRMPGPAGFVADAPVGHVIRPMLRTDYRQVRNRFFGLFIEFLVIEFMSDRAAVGPRGWV